MFLLQLNWTIGNDLKECFKSDFKDLNHFFCMQLAFDVILPYALQLKLLLLGST